MTGARGQGPDAPLAGVSVLVPRSAGQAGPLIERLRDLGAAPVEAPTIEIRPPRDAGALTTALGRVAEGDYDWVAFTSPNAVSAVLDPPVAADLGPVLIAAVGSGTRRALAERGRRADLVPRRATARGLADELVARERSGRVLLPRADIASSGLPRALEEAGWLVDEVEAYRTLPVKELPEHVREDLRGGRIEVIALTSGSTARNLVALLDGRPPADARIVSIGPSTTAVCDEIGLTVDVEADPHDIDGLVAAIADALA